MYGKKKKGIATIGLSPRCLCTAALVFFSTFLSCSESKISKPESDQLYEEGLRYFYSDRLDQAGERFQKVLQLAPDSTVALVRLSEISLKQGRKNRAQNILWELCSPSASRDLSQADPIRLALLQLPPDLRGRPEARSPPSAADSL